MADKTPDQEPSIEEILASIRQIISDDEDKDDAPPAAAAPVEPAPVPKAPEPQKLTLDADGLFRFDRSELEDLLPASRAKIDAFITQVKTWKTVASIAITGHTDRLGSDAYNQRLSAARAETVKNYLVSQGASTNVIQAKSVGKSQPLTTAEQCPSSLKPAALIACLQPDRRIEIAIQGSKD